MRKYKCVSNNMYPFKRDEIYSGDFIAPRYPYDVETSATLFPKRWEEVKEETPKEPLDLTKILKGCEGQTFYSVISGEVTLDQICSSSEYPIKVVTVSSKTTNSVTAQGLHFSFTPGECILFPSKENRDWSTFKPKIPFGTPVMISNNGTHWKLKKFNGILQNTYIVPVDKFDFSNFEANKY